jgi:hypothetical protein
MIKTLKAFLVGMIVGALILAAVLIKFWPKPKQDPDPIDIVVNEPVESGNISGQVIIPPADPVQVFNPDFKVSVPVSGEFKTGSADAIVSGETTVERIGDLLSVNTIFTEAKIKIKYQPPPDPPEKLWHIGVYLSADPDGLHPGGFIQRNIPLFELGPVEMAAFGRIEMDMDTRLMAGVQISF